MDADFKEKRSAKISSNREKRWSMNSQRLEEIVAELMRPIGDLRHSFDTDLSALLEEYLTEAGIHALEADPDGSTPIPSVMPNFAELALLLQQSASIYGRKVDFLYQHVLSVSDSLHQSTIEIANTPNEEETTTPGGSRRKRRASAPSDFGPIQLEPCAAAKREPAAARPPPTLPRMYIELEPRVLAEGEDPLRDYAGEPIGVLADFHVSWRLQDGLLVEELEGWEKRQSLRPIPLMELQAAIEANAPPSPLPLREDSPPPEACPPPEASPPLDHSTPLQKEPPPSGDMPPPPPPVNRKERKRKAVEELNLEHTRVLCNSYLEYRRVLQRTVEFDGATTWIARVVACRRKAFLEIREAAAKDKITEFRGFDYDQQDISGFVGWSEAEATLAQTSIAQATSRLSTRLAEDSDDDGFFEQSSLGDSDNATADELHNATTIQPEKTEAELAEAAELAAWRARVAARAAAGERQAPLDVTQLAATVLDHVPEEEPKRFDRLLKEAAREETDVSRLFLATLFLANAGNVEVMQGPPLSLGTFSLKLLSRDARLYSAAAAADPISAPSAPPLTSTPLAVAVAVSRTKKK